MAFSEAQCPACKKAIQIPDDVDEPVCMYCGHRMKGDGSIPANTGPSVANLLGLAHTAAIGGNQDEALNYYNRVLEIDSKVAEAWIGKGKAAAWLSSLASMRLAEMLVAFGHAIGTTVPAEREAVTKVCVEEANRIVVALYGAARKHMLDHVSLPNSWQDYIVRVQQLLDALESVREWDPSDVTTLENIVHLCKDNIEGVAYRDAFNNNMAKAWHLTPAYEAIVRARLIAASERLKALNPDYVPPNPQATKPAECFVVTATMGDESHPTVQFMREFRETWLRHRPWGPWLIARYYRVGPVLARGIRWSRALQWASYVAVVAPAAVIARCLRKIQ